MKRYSLVFAFLFVVLCNVSWAGVEGRVKCGETTTIYTNNSGRYMIVTVLATDKCSGLDSAIIYSDSRYTIPDGQSTCISRVLPDSGTLTIQLECNGTNPRGYCTFVIVDASERR